MHDVQGALSKLYRLAWSKRMIAKRPLQEVDANLRNGEPMWRETGDGHGVTLIATDTGLAAIDIETKDANLAPAGTTRTSREGTKQAALIAVLRAPDGATIEKIASALGWAGHTVRGAMAGVLKRKLGLEVISEKIEGRGRAYKLPEA